MRVLALPFRLSGLLLLILVAASCVDPEDITLKATNDILVVDGTITNLAEPQVIKLNRSTADRLTGRFGTVAVTQATVDVLEDSSRVIHCHETIDGSYQLPSDFKTNTRMGVITRQRVAQIPFYDYQPGLVDIRQYGLTGDAYRYYKLFQDQTEKTAGLADTPPTALGGNVHQATNPNETVVGYFTASAVSLVHHWLDRKDYQGMAYGALDPDGPHPNVGDDFFFALNQRRSYAEPPPPKKSVSRPKLKFGPIVTVRPRPFVYKVTIERPISWKAGGINQ